MTDPDLPQIDKDLEKVIDAVRAIKDFEAKTSSCIREAINEVLRGDRTGRYSIAELTKQEKAHIGTQVEIAFLRDIFDLRTGEILDTTIAGVEVDIKNTILDNWMIPHEAVGHICLLVRINEPARSFSVGAVRTTADILNKPNQDGKRSLSIGGKNRIRWVANEARLSVSIFLRMPKELKDKIWAERSGQARVTQLFRLVQNEAVHRSDISTLAQQLDPAKRARDAAKKLRAEGILVLSGRYDRLEAEKKGFALRADEWVSLRA